MIIIDCQQKLNGSSIAALPINDNSVLNLDELRESEQLITNENKLLEVSFVHI